MENKDVKGDLLDQYGRPFPPKAGKYYVPSVTTDAVCVRTRGGKREVLLVTRGGPAEKGKLALPGGFIEYNERPEDCVVRELQEETGVKGSNPQLLGVFGDPLRDKRRHIITIVYVVQVDPDCSPKGGDDADHADFYSLEDILQRQDLAFDHLDILRRFSELHPN
jgi:ADP-ribose pyrophosphatase YjhB (NUDIX family)